MEGQVSGSSGLASQFEGWVCTDDTLYCTGSLGCITKSEKITGMAKVLFSCVHCVMRVVLELLSISFYGVEVVSKSSSSNHPILNSHICD